MKNTMPCFHTWNLLSFGLRQSLHESPDGLEYGVIATKDGRSVEGGIVVQLRAPACLGSCVVLSPYSPREASPKFRKYPFLQDVF